MITGVVEDVGDKILTVTVQTDKEISQNGHSAYLQHH